MVYEDYLVTLIPAPATLKQFAESHRFRAQELFENRGGCPRLPIPESPNGPCGRKATLKLNTPLRRTRKLCENRGGRPGLPVPNSPYGLGGRKATFEVAEEDEEEEEEYCLA